MATTRTGSFPIGYRRTWGAWQESLSDVIAFAMENDFACIDVGPLDVAELKSITDAGLKIGSVDAKDWGGLVSADAGMRKAAIDANIAYMNDVAKLGAENFFIVLVPADPAAPRADNFKYAVESLGAVCEGVVDSGARFVVEGWPGPDPHVPSLACTPADYRELLNAVDSPALGVNFDASHLIRMGIDPVRFLDEFATKVYHVHGKDTEIIDEAVQDHGNRQPATFAKSHGYGGIHWRYTLPGHGCARWTRMFEQLVAAGYDGFVSIELEDENFMETDELKMRGMIASRDFLKHV